MRGVVIYRLTDFLTALKLHFQPMFMHVLTELRLIWGVRGSEGRIPSHS
jgi:hypothetical protein